MTLETIIRLTEMPLEDKLTLQTFSGDHPRYCCVCQGGIDKDHKPIYYTLAQKEQLNNMYGNGSHGYCQYCLKIEKEKL